MQRRLRSAERGRFDHGWLQTAHSFSFADYANPEWVHFGPLRVMNEDVVAPGEGFGMHPHRDMEIVTYVLSGELEHRDSLGNHGIIRAGEMQRITAGTGILHSEFNPSTTTPVHLYQIWLFPHAKGQTPSYEQQSVSGTALERGRFRPVVTPQGGERIMKIHQDATIHLVELDAGQQATQSLAATHSGWLQVLRGRVRLGETELETGDGVGLSEISQVTIEALTGANEVMLFEFGM